VPEPIDWGAWSVDEQSAREVRVGRRMSLVNYSGTPFEIDVSRTVRLLDRASAIGHLGRSLSDDVRIVAFESSNTVTNAGATPWQPDTGLVSIWILGMFTPSPDTTVAIPFTPGSEETLGPIVNDAYFGKVPADRLLVGPQTLFFRGDGQYRSKIGLPPARALPVAGSYDAGGGVLTVVQYTRPPEATDYVNSMWAMQREPYRGDVINSYNDGPPDTGGPPLGPFYELETSSPALALAAGASYTHVHRTLHLVGAASELSDVARAVLGVDLQTIAGAFGGRAGAP
jgi:hypothetical protein